MSFYNFKGQYLKITPFHGVKFMVLNYPDITIQNPDTEMLYPVLYCNILYCTVIFRYYYTILLNYNVMF